MMWRRSTASGSVQETSRGVDAFVREPGGELAQRSSSGAAGARLKAKIAPFVLKHAIAGNFLLRWPKRAF